MRIMGGDIGGTTTRLRLLELSQGQWHEVFTREYRSADFHGLEAVIQGCLEENLADSAPLDAACFAVAGPVTGDCVRVTNLPWVLHRTTLQQNLHIQQVKLINDFSAIGYAVSELTPSEAFTLQEGRTVPQGVSALIGAGTGLGMGLVVRGMSFTQVLPSEGGHTDFAPVNEWQVDLWRWVYARKQRVSNEDLLSGRGLILLYEFVCERAGVEPTLLSASPDEDIAALVTQHAVLGDTQAEEAVNQFVSIYGAVAGNLALLVQPYAGLYIAGGIAAKLGGFMKSGRFMQAFRSKPPMSAVLEDIPVHIITDPHIGLKGAVIAARELLTST